MNLPKKNLLLIHLSSDLIDENFDIQTESNGY